MIFIDEIQKLYVGKYLTLYKFEWVENRNKKGDFKEVHWKSNDNLGEYNFKYLPSTRGSGLKWHKLHKETMIVTEHKFLITEISIDVDDDYPHSESLIISLKSFPDKNFNTDLYSDLVVNDEIVN